MARKAKKKVAKKKAAKKKAAKKKRAKRKLVVKKVSGSATTYKRSAGGTNNTGPRKK